MKKLSLFLICCLLWGASPLAASAEEVKNPPEPIPLGPFADVPTGSAYALALAHLKEEGVLEAFSDGHFYPEKKIKRAEALAMVMRAADPKNSADAKTASSTETNLRILFDAPASFTIENAKTGEKTSFQNIPGLEISQKNGIQQFKIAASSVTGGKKIFDDVSEQDWFFAVVREAKERGIVKGKKKGKYFRPNAPVNLAETLRMLFQAAGIKTAVAEAPLPAGMDEHAWYAKDIAYAASRGILTQQEDGRVFPPYRHLTRGQLGLILYRFLKTKSNVSFGYASWYADGLAKTKITNGLEYKEKNLTAAHKTLPMGSIVRVTNMTNGKSVSVLVNDRGPFVTGRIIDLSKTAFSALESPTIGIMQVQIEPLDL